MNWVSAAVAAGMLPAFALLARLSRGRWWRARLAADWASSGAGLLIGCATEGAWVPSAIGGAHVAIGLWLWWRGRRARKRAPRAYGAKSRARLAALVRKAREAARPRLVLRPVPGGVRA